MKSKHHFSVHVDFHLIRNITKGLIDETAFSDIFSPKVPLERL